MPVAATERVLIVGAGAAGLLAAVFLARSGREVLVVDRDRDAATAAVGRRTAEPRPGVPQARHSHAFLARFRALLAQRAPDLLDALLAAGAREIPLLATAPAPIRRALESASTAAAQAPAGGPDELVVLGCRRPLLDDVLRGAALAEPGVTIQPAARVTGLVTDGGGAAPWVRGVRLADGTSVAADLVIDAGGRRSPVRELLAAAGAPLPPQLAAPCGITYYSRFYTRDGDRSLVTELNRGHAVGASFDRYSCLVFPADNDTFSVTFGVLPEDTELRALRHGPAFDAAVRAIEAVAPWLDGGPATSPAGGPGGAGHDGVAVRVGGAVRPLGPVAAMAGLYNLFRPLVDDGRPAALGVLPIGDAAMTTNPAHTRGTTLAALGAARLTDAVTATADPAERALRLDAAMRTGALPWFHDSLEQDASRLARWRSSPPSALASPDRSASPDRWDSPGPPVPSPRDPTEPGGHERTRATAGARRPRSVTNGEAFLAAGRDPVVWQAFTRLQNLLAMPSDVLADPEIVARVRTVQTSGWRPPALVGPSHAGLVAAARAALAGQGDPAIPGGAP